MTTDIIRRIFIDFFVSKGLVQIPSASLLPENDPSVLFTTAGMQPLVPYLLGEKHPQGTRLVDYQKCLRTTDIDVISDSSHLTLIEMLGHWSLGDYYKKEAISWLYQWLTSPDWLDLDPKRLFVTVFKGDEIVPRDEESIAVWQDCFSNSGIEALIGERIALKNRFEDGACWWEIEGADNSPAGPDTEVYYYVGESSKIPPFDSESDDFIEICNTVFMSYQKQIDGSYQELENKNVDFGGGLERLAMVKQGVKSVHDTDNFLEMKKAVIALLIPNFDFNSPDQLTSLNILVDHLRSCVFLCADSAIPSNSHQGYVLRRLARRAIRHGLRLGIKKDLFVNLTDIIIHLYQEAYPELAERKTEINLVLAEEEEKFLKTLEKGLRYFEKITDHKQARSQEFTGEDGFYLFDTYGFPKELSLEEAQKRQIKVAEKFEDNFQKQLQLQKERSRTLSKGIFKGGLADNSDISTRYHTATHLLYRSLRNLLGDSVVQRGSNINHERTRFDFSFSRKLTALEIQEVEDMVNLAIARDYQVSWRELPLTEAYQTGAIGAFGERYPEVVKVYTIGNKEQGIFSQEICGGPHVENTREIGKFKIVKEEAVAAGVRRIKAVLE